MMRMKKMIAANKACTSMVCSAMGAIIGVALANVMISKCCCAEKIKCKAKNALKNMEGMF